MVDDPAAAVRLDVWLDVSCLFKTRSEAQRACKGGKIDVNGQPAKPHRDVHIGDEIEINRGFGGKQTVRVRVLAEHHIPRAEARQLYEDLTPLPSLEEIEQRRLARAFRAAVTPPKSPDKRARRELRRARGKS